MKAKIPTAASYCASTRTVRSEPENYCIAGLMQSDAALDIDAAGFLMAGAPALLAALEGLLNADVGNATEAIAAANAAIAAAKPPGPYRYRYTGLYGMTRVVGSTDPFAALIALEYPGVACEFARLNKPFKLDNLEVWNGESYVPA